MTQITIETRGRRHYVLGNTYPIRAALRSAGCKWDHVACAWYSGSRDKVEGFAASVAAGQVEAVACYRKLGDGTWGVLVPGSVEVGVAVTVETKAGARKTETVTAVVEATDRGTLCRVAQRERKPRAPRQPSFVGERGEFQSEFRGERDDRAPRRKIGDSCYLKHRGERIPVVVVGYEPAQYVRSEDAEDMGHYGVDSGYYGALHYRRADEAEAAALYESEAPKRAKEAAAAAHKERVNELRSLCLQGTATPELEIAGIPAGPEIVTEAGTHGSGREVAVLTESGVALWHGGHYDDYRRSLHTTSDPRAIELFNLLSEAS